MNQTEIQDAINHFKFRAAPSDGTYSNPATVGDIQKLIKETAILFEKLASISDNH